MFQIIFKSYQSHKAEQKSEEKEVDAVGFHLELVPDGDCSCTGMDRVYLYGKVLMTDLHDSNIFVILTIIIAIL